MSGTREVRKSVGWTTEDYEILVRNTRRCPTSLPGISFDTDLRDANAMRALTSLHTLAPDTAYEHNRDNANVEDGAELDRELSA